MLMRPPSRPLTGSGAEAGSVLVMPAPTQMVLSKASTAKTTKNNCQTSKDFSHC